jgi:predicted lipoprotein with Yx(FWY)xxD motif
MKSKITLVSAAAALIAAVLIPASLAGPSKGSSATVGVSQSKLGRILVDGRGRSLYLFEKDKHGRSACSGVCEVYWPPLLTNGRSIAIKGAKPSLLGSIRRADGSRQVSYAGHPLYYFSGDTSRGQTKGEGLQDFGAGWYTLAPSGKKIDRD